MKKVLVTMLLLVALLIPFMSNAETWKVADSVTVAWDAVTTLTDGTPVPTTDGSVIQYRVYYKKPSGTPVEFGVVNTTNVSITFANEGRYYVGVKAERVVDGATVEASEVSWSNLPAYVQNGNTFGILFYKPPKPVTNLR